MKVFFWVPQILLLIATFVGLLILLAPVSGVVRGWQPISIVTIGATEILLLLYYGFVTKEKTTLNLAMFTMIGALTAGVLVATIHTFYIPLDVDVVKETVRWLAGITISTTPLWVCTIGLLEAWGANIL